MSIFDQQPPITLPAPALNAQSGANDPRTALLAQYLAGQSGQKDNPGALGGLDKIAKMALSAYQTSQMRRPNGADPNAASTPSGSIPDANRPRFIPSSIPDDPGMSFPGSGGFGSETGAPAYAQDGSMPRYNGPDASGMGQMPDPAMMAGYAQRYGGGPAIGPGEPGGPAMGGAPGTSGAGSPAGSKIICTELHRQGMMSDDIYQADQRYGALMASERPNVMAGYHRLASPVVSLMRRSRLVTRVMAVIVAPWAREMAHVMGVTPNGSCVGYVMMRVGIFVCSVVGKGR